MYGGVSLAVYINGTAHELFRAVRGRGVYRLIKALTDSDIVVDVLSGTSAGGINGILLAFALCNEREFGGTARLWRDHGDLGRLLRDPGEPLATFHSLLDSESYYRPRLEAAFRAIHASELSKKEREDPSPCREMDVFITGTNFDGRETTQFDDLGHEIVVRDYRTLFWLKHRENRKCPFAPDADAAGRLPQGDLDAAELKQRADDNFHALSKLAQITSCFPGAFSPVTVVPGADGADDRLALWGQLDRPTVLIDGGVLDNKPFMSTLQAIYYRMAIRPVSRYLLYVDPDPETQRAASSHPARTAGTQGGDVPQAACALQAIPTTPTIVRTALGAIFRIPSYESIADDLRAISTHNDAIQRFKDLTEIWGRTEPSLRRDAAEHGPGFELYVRARLLNFADWVLSSILDLSPPTQRNAASRTARLHGMNGWAQPLFESLAETRALLAEFDIDFHIRRLLALTYIVNRAPDAEPNTVCIELLNRQVQLLETLRSGMETALRKRVQVTRNTRGAIEVMPLWRDAQAALRDALGGATLPACYSDGSAPGSWTLEKTLTPEELTNMLGSVKGAREARTSSARVLEQTASFERRLVEQCGLRAEYDRFAVMDTALYPVELVSGLREKDVIRTVRFSPRDAQLGFSALDIEKKVCGIRLGHFAAFLKKSWRANDLLWGRLDGLCQLVETLLDRERVAAALSLSGRSAALQKAISEEELDPDHLFPSSPAEERAKIRAWLWQLCDESTRAAALAQLRPSVDTPANACILNTLVKAAQLEILREDLRSVAEDAIEEQLRWNLYAIGNRTRTPSAELKADAAGRFLHGDGNFDALTALLASNELAHQAIERLTSPTREVQVAQADTLTTFFKSYDVGGETLARDLPRIVVLELLARCLLVGRNALVNSLGPRADAVRESLLYKLFLDWPLRIFAALARTLRSAPAAQKGLVIGAIAYIALSLVVLYLWGKSIFDPGDGTHLPGMLMFVIAPAVLSGFVLALLEQLEFEGLWRTALRGAFRASGLLAILFGALALWRFLFAEGGSACQGLVWPLGWACTQLGLNHVPRLLKLAALLLPTLGGVLTALRLRRPPRREGELKRTLRQLSSAQLEQLWLSLTKKSPPWHFRLHRVRALLNMARRDGQLVQLEELAKLARERGRLKTAVAQPQLSTRTASP